ncbi:helix-turn-helix domain-containing protein [Aquipuribacter nitratireducens]|uniref:Helix-turn-helix transcriptional regulator n=1 Tax=Aquipuribacter nitratireducens TaxID=650104 RepID=A0ABW0GPP7_9MICO
MIESFDERDRQVLSLLRPHLYEVWQRAERRRVGAPSLTPRQEEVLRLVGRGLSYAEVAARLVVSRGTVRAHMDHIRRRLGVSSAAEAAAALALSSAGSAGR